MVGGEGVWHPLCIDTHLLCSLRCMSHCLHFIVPCYKRVFVAECHNRYSEVYWQGSLNTRYAVGFGRGRREGGERGERRGKRGKGAERAIPMSREGVAVLSS